MTTLKKLHTLMMEKTLSIVMYIIILLIVIVLFMFIFSNETIMNSSIYLNYFR